MHFSQLSLLTLAASTASVLAFPRGIDPSMLMARHAEAEAAGCPFALKAKRDLEATLPKKRAVFNAKAQLVDVTGKYKFVPPGPNDLRGPCPGLNALANHNFLPHNGVATAAQLVEWTNKVYGMSLDLGAFLAVYGTVFDGNPLSLTPGYSIGGPAPANDPVAGKPLGLFAQPQGLSGSHNKYETDTSATRGDLYVVGNNYKVQLHQFNQYYNALKQNTDSQTQYDNLLNFHKSRYDDSLKRNPYFFYSPFAGVLVAPAAFNFPVRMMANHSAKFPNGYLERSTFASFFAVSGKPGSFVYKEGWERIPDNWYRRPIGDDYSIPAFLVDVLNHGARYPPLLIPGGSTGQKGKFVPLNLNAVTKGVFDTATLTQGNNAICLAFQIAKAATPDILIGGATTVVNILGQLSSSIDIIVNTLGCPQLSSIDKSQFNMYPGYNKQPIFV